MITNKMYNWVINTTLISKSQFINLAILLIIENPPQFSRQGAVVS